ncbi:unnamed protein product [Cylindrotheca closterium]|uniref:Uncharacterized protein n=1 Tax=Cylindrotheca closterium TaxID=2856 RepID=A0AAD2FUL9_9STRA|nr:unnamed protein product [Cylindrotheca closterium]
MGKYTSLKVVSTAAKKAGGSKSKSGSTSKKSGKKRLENASSVELRQPKDRDPKISNDSGTKEVINTLRPLIDFGLSTQDLVAIGYDKNSTQIEFGNHVFTKWMDDHNAHWSQALPRFDSPFQDFYAKFLDRLPQVLGDSNNVVCGVHSLTIRSMKTSRKSYLIKPEQLACRWRTSIECARRTLEKTTQRAVRDCSVFPNVSYLMMPDDAKSLTQGKFREVANKGQVPIHPIEPHHSNEALTEDIIREGSRLYRRFMHARNIPIAFWDRVFMYAFEIRSHMALGLAIQEGECGATIVSGNTKDISHLVDFAIWDWCWCLSPNRSSKDGKQLCRWLGPSFTIGAALCFAVAIANGQVLQRSSVIPLSAEERNSEPMEEKKKEFMEDLKKNLKKKSDGVSISEEELDRIRHKYNMPISAIEDGGYPQYAQYEDHPQEDPHGVEAFGVVQGRKRDSSGKLIGHYRENPHLDTSIYQVEFEDGKVESFYANQIIERIMMNVDDEGNTMYRIREFIDHQRDRQAVRGDNGWYTTSSGLKRPQKKTKGWKVLAEMKGGETEWLDLSVAKEAFPIEVAEYAVANKVVSEPAFA